MRSPEPDGLPDVLPDELPSAPASPARMPTAPSVTVAICTHDRASDVRRCCEGLAPQVEDAGFELIIVDSGSGEEEARELRWLSRQFGARYVRSNEPGLALARNLACEAARAEWVAFLDDDAIPYPDWAKTLLARLESAPPEVAVVGGRTVPLWPAGVPAHHVTGRWMLLLSCVQIDGDGAVSDGFNIVGANMAVRRAAVAAAGGFPTATGRTGTALLSGEESFLFERLFELGMISIYHGSISVWHRIPEARLDRAWVARRAYWEGASQIAVAEALRRPVPWWLSRPKLVLSLPVLWALREISSNPDYLIRYNMVLGALIAQSQRWFRHLHVESPAGRVSESNRGEAIQPLMPARHAASRRRRAGSYRGPDALHDSRSGRR